MNACDCVQNPIKGFNNSWNSPIYPPYSLSLIAISSVVLSAVLLPIFTPLQDF